MDSANDNWANNDWTAQQIPPLTDQQRERMVEGLISRLRGGDDKALAELFSFYQNRFLRMIDFRLDPQLRSRIDPSDILQDAYIDATKDVQKFLARGDSTVGIWLRLIVLQRLQMVVRYHLLTEKRDARKEVAIDIGDGSRQFSRIAQMLADSITSPSAVLARDDAIKMVERMLSELPLVDREVLVLRHFEQLINDEVAEVLGISRNAASNRYVRALRRIQTLIESNEQAETREVVSKESPGTDACRSSNRVD